MAQAPAPSPSPEMQAMYAELLDAVSHGARLRQALFVAQAKIAELEAKLSTMKPPIEKP